MGRKRKTRWRRLSIGEISANEEEEDVELGGAVIVPNRNQHSPVKQMVDKSSTMTHTNSSSPLENSSTANMSGNGGASNHHNHYHGSNDVTNSSNRSSPHNSHNSGHHSSSSNSSGAASTEPNASYSSNHHPSHNSHHNGSRGGDYYHKDYYHPNHHHNHHNQSSNNGSGPQHNHHYNGGRGDYHHKDYNNSKEYQNGSGGGGGGGEGGRGGHYSGYHNNYYGSRNSYNNYRNYNNGESGGGGRNSGGGGGEHYHGNGSDYHYSPSNRSYGGGRYRKPRSYPPSNYYYSNNGSSQDPSGDQTNRPSYNQDEYTKITTPRQDVLFKKGYLSQKKSSSVDSASATTTPSASTNGTPDTQSTNGINSDYSEGYENGETDCVIPYDDTIYYGPPPEAVFTDPNTGQVYYGHCSSNGEYFDAYPVSQVMVAGYPTPVYYHLPYPTVDWNGVPTSMYPVCAAPPPMPIEDPSYSIGLQGVDTNATMTRDRDTISTTPTPATSYTSTTSTTLCQGVKGDEVEVVENVEVPCGEKEGVKVRGSSEGPETTRESTPPTPPTTNAPSTTVGSTPTTPSTPPTTSSGHTKGSIAPTATSASTGNSLSTSSSPPSSTSSGTSCSSSKTTTVAVPTVPPIENVYSSAPIAHQYQSKHGHHGYMTPVPYMGGSNLQNQHPHHHPRHHNHHHHHGGPVHHPPPHHAVHHPPPTLALAAGPPPVHPPFHLYPHPAGFVYGHPVYNGVVVPIAPAASAADASNSSLEISPSSRKKRKKRRRKKDGQLTDECSDETSSNPDDCEYDEEDQELSPELNYGYTYYYGAPSIGIAQVCVPNPTVLIPHDNQLEPEPQVTTETPLTKDNFSDDSYSSYCEANSASFSELVKSKSQEDIAKAKDLIDKESSPPTENICADEQQSLDQSAEETLEMDQSEGKEGKENQTTSSADNSANQEDGGDSNDSGNRVEETSEASAESVSTSNVVCEGQGAVSSSTTSTGKSSSKKPVDLTVQCPPGGSLSNFAELQLLNLQRSPDGNNEPSSPDSLNTNQSVAGSEIAAGETLSVSESDLMNRTTSIDEVEEDLPPEHTNEPEVYCETTYPSGERQSELPVTLSTSPNTGDLSPQPLISTQDEYSEEGPPESVVEVEDQIVSKNIDSSQSTSPVSVSEVDIFLKEEKEEKIYDALEVAEVETIVDRCDQIVSSIPLVEIVDSEELPRHVEEETVNSLEVEKSEADAREEEGGGESDPPPQPETAERPKSITLAVSEWLKTQGDDVLTPVIPSNSISSEEVDDDIEEEIEGDIEDSDEEVDEQSEEAQSQRINELNQKNVHGNPWVAPSNKSESGSFSKKNRLLNRRSESKGKREHHPLNNKMSKNANINKGVCQDGVCSRVAPKFSPSFISNTNCLSTTITPEKIADSSDENFFTASTSNAMASTRSNSDIQMDTDTTTILNHSQNTYVSSSGSKDEDSGLELSSPESCETNEKKDIKKVSRNLRKSEERDLSQNNKLILTLVSDNAEEADHLDSQEYLDERMPTSPPVSSALPTPASSIDERNQAESCDPQKFAKYYQFGVVFDKEQDHGIDDASHIEDPSVENAIFTFNDRSEEKETKFSRTNGGARQKKGAFAIANTFSLSTSLLGQRQSKTVQTQHSQPNEQVILKGYCDENEDEEIGTFDPRKLNRRKNSFKSCNTDKCPCGDFASDNLNSPLYPISDSSSPHPDRNQSPRKSFSPCATFPYSASRKLSSLSTEDGEDEIEGDMDDAFATAVYEDFLVGTSVSTSSGHMYVNPMSLAAELVSSSSSTKAPLPDTWDVDSEPLPPYESPPSVDINVFNHNTPQAKIIRSKFHSAGEPIPCAICCVIQ